MLHFKDNQVTGSKFQEWSFSIVHNNSEQSFDSLKHFSHKRKLLLPKILPAGLFAETEKSQFFFFGFCQKFTRCQKLERTELKIMLSSSKNKEKHNNGRNLGPGRGGKLGKKITHINFATLIGRVFVCCNDAEKDVIPTWLSAANIDDNSSIFVRCDHLTKAASAVKQVA